MNKKSWLAIGVAVALALLLLARAIYTSVSTGVPADLILTVTVVTVLIIFLTVFLPLGISTSNRLRAVTIIRAGSPGSVVFSVVADEDLKTGLKQIQSKDGRTSDEVTRFLVVEVKPSSVRFWTAQKVPRLLTEVQEDRILELVVGELPYAYGTRSCLFLRVSAEPVVELPLLAMNETSSKYMSQTPKEVRGLASSSLAVLGQRP